MKKIVKVKIIFTSLFFLLLLSSCQKIYEKREAIKGYLKIPPQASKPVEIIGEWEFYPFEVLTSDSLEKIDLAKKNFIKITKNKNKLFNNKPDTGYATYSIKIKLPNTGLYAIKYAFLYTNANIYLFDKLVFSQGNFSTNKNQNNSKYAFGIFPFIVDSLAADSTIRITIHVSDYSSNKKFGITKPLILGEYRKLSTIHNVELVILYVVIGILLIMFLYNLFIYLFYPKNKAILYFSLMTISIAVRSFVTSSIYMPPLDFSLTLRISFLSAVFFVFFTMMFYKNFVKNFIKNFYLNIFYLYSACLILFYILAPIQTLDSSTIALYIYIFIPNLYFLIKLLVRTIQKSQYSFPLFLAQLIFFLSMLNDMLFYLRIVQWGYVSHYTVSVFVIIEAIIIAKNLSNIYKTNLKLYSELEYQNKNLEFLIEQRTKEIAQKNKELQKLSLIAEKSHNVIIVFDRNFDLIWANQQFEIFYNLKVSEAYKKINLIKNSTNKNIEKIVEAVLQGKSVNYISRCFSPKEKRWAQTTLTPLMQNGSITEIIAIESDITKIKKIERKLLEHHHAIKSSLQYAQTIQKSILPDTSILSFQNTIIYRPKEIVSGDFYFFREIYGLGKPTYIIGIADCTGHGVPGAFMTFIVNYYLNYIIDSAIFDPADILNMLNEKIKNFLTKNKNNYNSTDGAAISLLKITREENLYELTYSTANLSFSIYHKNQKNISFHKTNVSHIGWYFSEQKFFQKTIQISKDDIIYLYSDGYYDQLNTAKKKFGKKNFFDLILVLGDLNLETQKIIFEDTFDKWKKEQEQYDDVLLWIIRIS